MHLSAAAHDVYSLLAKCAKANVYDCHEELSTSFELASADRDVYRKTIADLYRRMSGSSHAAKRHITVIKLQSTTEKNTKRSVKNITNTGIRRRYRYAEVI
jgi:hypothetical protein